MIVKKQKIKIIKNAVFSDEELRDLVHYQDHETENLNSGSDDDLG